MKLMVGGGRRGPHSHDHLAVGHVKLICDYEKSLGQLMIPRCRTLTSFAGQMNPHFFLVFFNFLPFGSIISLQISQVPPTGECKCWSDEVRAIGVSEMSDILILYPVKPSR